MPVGYYLQYSKGYLIGGEKGKRFSSQVALLESFPASHLIQHGGSPCSRTEIMQRPHFILDDIEGSLKSLVLQGGVEGVKESFKFRSLSGEMIGSQHKEGCQVNLE